MGDDIRFHDSVACIVRCGQRVRVGRNVSPEILHLSPLAVDLFLVVIYECVALPMRGAPQLATGITGVLKQMRNRYILALVSHQIVMNQRRSPPRRRED